MIPCVLVRKSTKTILNPNCNYPREDGEPVVGLDPDLLYLAKHTPYAEPEYDPRIYILVTVLPDLATIDFDTIPSHPDWPNIKEYLITYSTERRPEEEIAISIDNAESLANQGVFPSEVQTKSMLLAISSLIKLQNGLTLNTDEQANIDSVVTYSATIWANDQINKAKKAAITEAQVPDIDEGFIAVLP
jgi:hypothetical protein